MVTVFESSRLNGHRCWECRYFEIDIRHGIPPTKDYSGHCMRGERSSGTSSLRGACIWGRADDERIKLSIVPVMTTPRNFSPTKKLELSEHEIFLLRTAVESANKQGSVRTKELANKGLRVQDLKPLVERGLIETVETKDGKFSRLRILRIARVRQVYLGD